ncbi:MAG: hypothetical protein K5766_02975 [Alphaproteobacteria bacterium]|nr:hypothetical protein [Alphaproteobacteria bacterium]
MKKLLFVFVMSLCYVGDAISMEPDQTKEFTFSQEMHLVSDFDNTDKVVKKIWQEEKECKFDTEHKVLEAAEKGDEKAFKIIQRLLNEYFCGLSYTIASAIHEKKFVSPSMTEILLENEDIQDALNEIIHGSDVKRIILEGTGAEKHWMDVLKDARNGDNTSFAVIMKLLEKRYLLDLPYVIAWGMKKGVFVNSEQKKRFSDNASVVKELKRLETSGEWEDKYLEHTFI